MIYTIENDFLKVSINKKGAELVSVFRKDLNIEYIWQAKEYSWKKHAPNLFPFIGNIKNGGISYKIDDLRRTYIIGKHGFAKDMDFECFPSFKYECYFVLRSNCDTKKHYPYEFEFTIKYKLEDDKLIISYKVRNIDNSKIYFNLGTHIAFSCDLEHGDKFDDYYIEFKDDELNYYAVNHANGLLKRECEKLYLDENKLHIDKNLFKEKDSLVVEGLVFREVKLRRSGGIHGICYRFLDAPILTLWTPVDSGEFICIEPWYGICDFEDSSLNIEKKDYINVLQKGSTMLFENEICFF